MKLRDELTMSQLKQVKNIAGTSKWLESFLVRFHEQAKKSNLSNKEICEKANENRSPVLSPDYILKPNALSQYTNVQSRSPRVISIEPLIAIASAFGVSLDYLLGIEERENHVFTDIYKASGLNTDAIKTIKDNYQLQNFLNFCLSTKYVTNIIDEISQLCFMDSLYRGVFSDFGTFKKQIEDIFSHFYTQTYPMERTQEEYINYLKKELFISCMQDDTQNHTDLLEYLKRNISSSLYYQFILVVENNDDKHKIFLKFVDEISDRTYEVLIYNQTKKLTYLKILDLITLIIEEYSEQKRYGLASRNV